MSGDHEFDVNAENIEEAYDKALQLIDDLKDEQADNILRAIVAVDPHFIPAKVALVGENAESIHDSCLHMMELIEEETAYLNEKGALDQVGEEAMRLLRAIRYTAERYAGFGYDRKALELYKRMMDIDHDDYLMIRYNMGDIMFRLQMFEELKDLLKKYEFDNIYKDFVRMAMSFLEGDTDDFVDYYNILKISFPKIGLLFVHEDDEMVISTLEREHFFDEDEDMDPQKMMFILIHIRYIIESNPMVFDNREFDAYMYMVDEDVQRFIDALIESECDDDEFVYCAGEA